LPNKYKILSAKVNRSGLEKRKAGTTATTSLELRKVWAGWRAKDDTGWGARVEGGPKRGGPVGVVLEVFPPKHREGMWIAYSKGAAAIMRSARANWRWEQYGKRFRTS